jgi:hypothetical protein
MENRNALEGRVVLCDQRGMRFVGSGAYFEMYRLVKTKSGSVDITPSIPIECVSATILLEPFPFHGLGKEWKLQPKGWASVI